MAWIFGDVDGDETSPPALSCSCASSGLARFRVLWTGRLPDQAHSRITEAKHRLLGRKTIASAALLVLLALPIMQPQTASFEKETHFKVYWHDLMNGLTSALVACTGMTNTSKTAFGVVLVIDNPLTEGPSLNSSRLMGTYIAVSKDQLVMLMNFVFTAGKYNGSSVIIIGRNVAFTKVLEMAVVGGTGIFRLARGYAQGRTHTLVLKAGDATVEHNIFIRH
ncbi:dirigent protein 22-like [Triticum dicoccoides]|uniref:dirigent protein 22-like n=1 Tax=Triticum dicoccoides TaxID=85692 RepID=UPI00188EC1E2|nr:dirigent protein 22-like [Triticum dicoccoides]